MEDEAPAAEPRPKSTASGLRRRAWRAYLRRRWGRVAAFLIIGLGVIGFVGHTLGGIAGLWEFYHFTGKVRGQTEAAVEQQRGTASTRPFRSVAILPFKSDEASAQFAEQLTADFTNAARRTLPDSLVVSNTLVKSYAQGTHDPRKIGAELNVRYVVVGALRANELALELIDALDGAHLWSTRARLAPSAPTDTIVKLGNALDGALDVAMRNELQALPTKQREALTLLLRVEQLPFTPANWRTMQGLLEEALRIDPDLVAAMLNLQVVLFQRAQEEPANRAAIVAQFDRVSQRAISIASTDPRVWNWRAFALQWQGNWSGAFAASDRALQIDPYSVNSLNVRAWLLLYTGQGEEALGILARAGELTDRSLDVARCCAYLQLRRDREAVETCERAAAVWDFWIIHAFVTIAHANVDNRDAMALWAKKLKAAKPDVTLASLADLGVSNHPAFVAEMEKMRASLRKAGIPER